MTRDSLLTILILLITVLGGCSVAPSEHAVAGAITDYFKSRHYKVVNLKIEKIEGLPLSEKTYMGTPGYVVDIDSITIEPQTDKDVGIEKSKQLTFSNARVRITQDKANKNVWRVTIISGISVP
ncbi:MAG: hypothetical protein EHM54_05725 [Nitrospiraceae bacterium]|nr:MAG: hypothetical protein EHM54_05725 [Nitrospiraceae bacterium]